MRAFMIMLHKLERLVYAISNWFANIGVAFMLALVAVSFIDIIGGKLFNQRVPGLFEIVGFLDAVMIAFMAGLAQYFHTHIRVDTLASKFPLRTQTVVSSFIYLVLLCMFTVLVWQLFKLGLSFKANNEHSLTLRLPLFYVGFAIAIGLIPQCFVLLLQFIESVGRIKVK